MVTGSTTTGFWWLLKAPGKKKAHSGMATSTGMTQMGTGSLWGPVGRGTKATSTGSSMTAGVAALGAAAAAAPAPPAARAAPPAPGGSPLPRAPQQMFGDFRQRLFLRGAGRGWYSRYSHCRRAPAETTK